MSDLNKVILTGSITRVGLGWLSSGKPELRLNLQVEQDAGFKLYVAVFCYGQQCERLAETLEVGQRVWLDGKLSWRTSTKDGVKESKMVVTTYSVEILTPSAEPVGERSPHDECDFTSTEPAMPTEAPAKVRKPRYPKWKPTPAESSN